ncbi:MAG: S1 RNA-binding domain-containing protein, partial [Nitrospirota bacterium]|nr:S1 RNA-binding domain-containing protein [Nitrospirota bacterium]
ELEGDVEGLIHISETGQDSQEKLEEIFKVGEPITSKVVKVDCEERKIALSLREYSQETDSNELEKFNSSQSDIDKSLGRVAKNEEAAADQE